MKTLAAAIGLICVLHNSNAVCPPAGDSKEARIQALDLLKNRTAAPAKIDDSITLDEILAPGNDANRFQIGAAATITGYVVAVKRGGLESCNCHSAASRDWHIELATSPDAPAGQIMIVEVTPHFAIAVEPKRLVGHSIDVSGWMFFDDEHAPESAHTAAKGNKVWRATAWEIHPVTLLRINSELSRNSGPIPGIKPQSNSEFSRWIEELRAGKIDLRDFRSLVAGQRELESYPFRP